MKPMKVFIFDEEDDETLSVNPANVGYDWPSKDNVEIVSWNRVFYGPVMLVIDDKNLFKFDNGPVV